MAGLGNKSGLGSKSRLGRGLDAMLPNTSPAPVGEAAGPKTVSKLAIEDIVPNPDQPRKQFDEQALTELADSIRELGVLEPIVVRSLKGRSQYGIIAGERRWRASQRAGLREVPVHILELSERQVLEAALVENLQREDLNPIETAKALHRLVEMHGHTHESLADRIGKSRSAVSNSVRLLNLPSEVVDWISDGRLSEGHGRALLKAELPARILVLARRALDAGWSVRETERRVRLAKQKAEDAEAALNSPDGQVPRASAVNANIRAIERRIQQHLGLKVKITDRDNQGTLEIRYSSLDDFDKITDRLLK